MEIAAHLILSCNGVKIMLKNSLNKFCEAFVLFDFKWNKIFRMRGQQNDAVLKG